MSDSKCDFGRIGQSPMRVDGPAKVTGNAKYVADLPFAGALHSAVVASKEPRARLLGIDFDPSFDWSGVTVVTAADVPNNVIAYSTRDQPVLVDTEIRHRYEPVVLLACADKTTLQNARSHVTLRTQPLPPVFGIDDALTAKVSIWGSDNVMRRYRMCSGDVDAALSRSEVVVAGIYDTGYQEHAYLEPNGCVAWWDSDGMVHVVGSIQCPYYVHNALIGVFGIPGDKVDVAQAVTGGAFGGKEEFPSVLALHAALLSRKSARPVRMIYDRQQDIETSTKRHPSKIWVQTGCDLNGTLRALRVRLVLDAGAYVTITPVVLSRATLHMSGAYRWNDVLVESEAVATNTPPNGAFRGFGAPQALFALERHLDAVAAELRIDPLELRKRNLLSLGARMPAGQVLSSSVGVAECVAIAEKKSDYVRKRIEWSRPQPRDRMLRGVGASVVLHGGGFTGTGEAKYQGAVAVDLLPHGQLLVRSSSTDMGQGTETVFRQIAANAAGIPIDDVIIAQPRTSLVPDSGPTVASRTVMIVGSVLEKAALDLAANVRSEFRSASDTFGAAADRLLNSKGAVSVTRAYRAPDGVQFDDETYTGTAYAAYAWACDIAEVEVDPSTFEVRVTGFWTCADVGQAVHRINCIGQLEGGALQGIGWTLCEKLLVGTDGKILNPNLTSYIIPTALDAPAFFTDLVEHPYPHGPAGGAKGIGELPMDGVAPAIAAAIEHATGLRFTAIPITPELVAKAWNNAGRSREIT